MAVGILHYIMVPGIQLYTIARGRHLAQLLPCLLLNLHEYQKYDLMNVKYATFERTINNNCKAGSKNEFLRLSSKILLFDQQGKRRCSLRFISSNL